MSQTRKYTSPLREAQARETREKILASSAALLETHPDGDFSMDEVARASGVERRTVFRHFTSRDALLDGLWEFINERLYARPRPGDYAELVDGMKTSFDAFDANAGIMRASLHTPAGQAMRKRSIPARRAAFHACISGALEGADALSARRIEAIAHLFYSAGAWEILKDYAGLDGREAGETVAWALETLVSAATRSASNKREK